MRAALLEFVGRMVMADIDEPVMSGRDQVLVQVRTVGICGCKVHAFEVTHPYRKAPAVLGHEMAGVVAETGRG